MKKYFKKDYVVHIEGYTDSFTINTLDKKLSQSILDIILKEQIIQSEHSVTEAQKQDSTTYEIFD